MFMNTLAHELFVYVCLFGKINEQQTLISDSQFESVGFKLFIVIRMTIFYISADSLGWFNANNNNFF